MYVLGINVARDRAAGGEADQAVAAAAIRCRSNTTLSQNGFRFPVTSSALRVLFVLKSVSSLAVS